MPHACLKPYQKQITEIDEQILALFRKRFQIREELMYVKRDNNIPYRVDERVEEVIQNNTEKGVKIGLSAEFVQGLYDYVIEFSHLYEDIILTHEKNTKENKEA